MSKQNIKNRKDQNIVVLVEETANPKGLVFIMHGLGGNKEASHIQTFADSFKENNYTVVRFDTTNTYGESDGSPEDATVTNYYQDLEDVISWAAKQSWYQVPFVLAGHSLGGICTALYAQNYPDKVKALAPISTVVSGKLSLETKDKDTLEDWEKTGYRIVPSSSTPGLMKKLKWSHIKDRLKYNLLEKVDKLTMPVLLIVGEDDDTTPVKHQKILYEKLPGKKELYIIKGAEHTFREPQHLKEIKEIFNKWIKNKINS